jgi:hypothetical protein
MTAGSGLRQEYQGDEGTYIYRRLIRDTRLDHMAMGILVELLDRPAGWDVRAEALCAERPEGKAAVRTALKKLREAGYYRLERRRLLSGKFVMGTAVSKRSIPEWIADNAKYDGKAVPVIEQEDGSFRLVEPTPAQPEAGSQPPVHPESGQPEDEITASGGSGQESPRSPRSTAGPEAGEPKDEITDAVITDAEIPAPISSKEKKKRDEVPVVTEALRAPVTTGRKTARTRETEPESDDSAKADPVVQAPTETVADHDRNATGLSVVRDVEGPAEAEKELVSRANQVAQEWWDSLEIKPMGRARAKANGEVSGSPATRKRQAFFALRASVAAALEQGWTEVQVKYVLDNRAKTVPSVQQLEVWLRSEAEAAEARRKGRGAPARGRSGGQQGWTPHRADLPEDERDKFRAMFGETPRQEAQ